MAVATDGHLRDLTQLVKVVGLDTSSMDMKSGLLAMSVGLIFRRESDEPAKRYDEMQKAMRDRGRKSDETVGQGKHEREGRDGDPPFVPML